MTDDSGHQHQVFTRQADVGRQAWPLQANRILGNLDKDVLTLAENVLHLHVTRPGNPLRKPVDGNHG